MKRRGFLGALGAVIAAPKALPKGIPAADLSQLDLSVASGVTRMAAGGGGDHSMSLSPKLSRVDWAKEALKRLLGIHKEEEELNMRTMWVRGLDEDTAALRSMSLGAKLRRTKRVQYMREKRENERRLSGIIFGGFTGD